MPGRWCQGNPLGLCLQPTTLPPGQAGQAGQGRARSWLGEGRRWTVLSLAVPAASHASSRPQLPAKVHQRQRRALLTARVHIHAVELRGGPAQHHPLRAVHGDWLQGRAQPPVYKHQVGVWRGRRRAAPLDWHWRGARERLRSRGWAAWRGGGAGLRQGSLQGLWAGASEPPGSCACSPPAPAAHCWLVAGAAGPLQVLAGAGLGARTF